MHLIHPCELEAGYTFLVLHFLLIREFLASGHGVQLAFLEVIQVFWPRMRAALPFILSVVLLCYLIYG